MADKKDPRFVTSMFPLVSTEGSVGFDSIRRDEVRKLINSHLKMLLLPANYLRYIHPLNQVDLDNLQLDHF